ncbi:uncharacterized protein BP5553_09900 [Venustampulla echinocandica]|uniref:SUR7 protein n=1 Tax=Venustampulla echinocandica TaxID=2656787 RepID=A0A370TB04_9HELO|nr:uncharacterized protein BP5553_09900 [Venustampulla echinocandica]RDL31111.1 hypothetical protein BP5553_09900 [Venustampulla echinocandica]
MGAGRFVCVAMPFGLTVASLICILIVMLAGVTNKNLDMFEIDVKNLSISSSSLLNIANGVKNAKREPVALPGDHFSGLTTQALGPNAVNITAADLNLADSYKVSLWSYCSTRGSETNCSKPKFNWATSATNVTELEQIASTKTNAAVKLPKELASALKTFTAVTKWTTVVYIIAIIATAVELVVGLFGFCSRVGSCVTYLVSGIATMSLIVATVMATAVSAIAVGAVKSVAKAYGVQASINTSFLATAWLAVAFSLAAGLFWLFSMCCCASDNHSKKRNSHADKEKLIPTGNYHHIENPQQVHSGHYGAPSGAPMYGGRGNGAYEPYSHTNI